MKKLLTLVFVILLLTQVISATAYASENQPVGRCAPAFEIHPFMDHTGDHMHNHIGTNEDSNGDGFICMKMLASDLHLHVDNSIPLR